MIASSTVSIRGRERALLASPQFHKILNRRARKGLSRKQNRTILNRKVRKGDRKGRQGWVLPFATFARILAIFALKGFECEDPHAVHVGLSRKQNRKILNRRVRKGTAKFAKTGVPFATFARILAIFAFKGVFAFKPSNYFTRGQSV